MVRASWTVGQASVAIHVDDVLQQSGIQVDASTFEARCAWP